MRAVFSLFALNKTSLYGNIFLDKDGDKMLIVVVSDNHRNLDVLNKIVKKYPLADLYLHAGDSESHDFEIEPFISVRGNCDHYIKVPHRLIDVEGFRIYLFHGHNTNLTADVLSAIAKNHDCNIIIHGHTHAPYYNFYNDVHILCPGSVSSSRSKFGKAYAIIKINNNDINVEIMKVNDD